MRCDSVCLKFFFPFPPVTSSQTLSKLSWFSFHIPIFFPSVPLSPSFLLFHSLSCTVSVLLSFFSQLSLSLLSFLSLSIFFIHLPHLSAIVCLRMPWTPSPTLKKKIKKKPLPAGPLVEKCQVSLAVENKSASLRPLKVLINNQEREVWGKNREEKES